MAVPLVGKIVITLISLAVAASMGVLIYFIVTDGQDVATTDGPTTAEATTPASPTTTGNSVYKVGVGIADMTGPCVEITFMGYAEVSQTGRGIHMRQFSRAFIFERGDTRVVLVSAEIQSVGIAVRREVVRKLQEKYGDMYSLRNVIIAGTHTHATPGGYLVDFLLDISIRGFSREVFDAYVDGITRSIVRAHENIAPSHLYFAQSTVKNVHMNRSPYSYVFNPEEERARYEGDTDDTLTQVRVEGEDGALRGVLNWYAIHTTSMNLTNQLISSDNLGYAALKLENHLNYGALPGKGSVVGAFFVANHGDVSPNIRGARCEFSGKECDNQFLICDVYERCYSLGPGDDMFESTKIIGQGIFEGALEALNSPGEELTGELAVMHQFVDMPQETVSRYDPISRQFDSEQQVRGCVAAMGYSFASGTIDGANNLNITQGTMENIPFLDNITAIVMNPSQEDRDCHAPKPILLATGHGDFPLPWHPHIASVSVIWLGDFVILGVPGEPTTMAGRRMRDVVGDVMERHGFAPKVAITSLTNEYIHYVSTYEEYLVQRYEAASTIYGPYTLDIFLNKFVELTTAAVEDGEVPAGPEPADNIDRTITLIPPVVADNSPFGSVFGRAVVNPPPTVRRGDTVSVTFVGANPRNNLRQESSHANVERLENGQWVVVATDAVYETRFTWERISTLLGTSHATLSWTVPADAIFAPHRVVYYGTAKSLLSGFTDFTGVSEPFNITNT